MKTSQLYLKYKEDNDHGIYHGIYHFFSFEELLVLGNPIDEEGIDMELESHDVYVAYGDEYVLLLA